MYKHFGREIVATTLALPESDPIVEKIYLKVYKSFIEGVDGIDNGVNMYDTAAPAKYSDNTGLSARVGKQPRVERGQLAGDADDPVHQGCGAHGLGV